VQAAHGAQQVRKAVQVAGFFQVAPAHHRREAEHLDAVFAMARHQRLQRVHHLFVAAGARMQAVDARRPKQGLGETFGAILELESGGGSVVHVRCALLLRGGSP